MLLESQVASRTDSRLWRVVEYGHGRSSDAEATSLSRMCDLARAAAASQGMDRHHFAVVQCPMNLYEAGAR